jgi:hypothetical protein
MKGWQKLICRATVVAGISFISLMIYYGYPPQMEAVYIATLNFGLSFLFFINTAFEGDDEKPKTRVKKTKAEQSAQRNADIKEQFNKARKKASVMWTIVAQIPNLWFP